MTTLSSKKKKIITAASSATTATTSSSMKHRPNALQQTNNIFPPSSSSEHPDEYPISRTKYERVQEPAPPTSPCKRPRMQQHMCRYDVDQHRQQQSTAIIAPHHYYSSTARRDQLDQAHLRQSSSLLLSSSAWPAGPQSPGVARPQRPLYFYELQQGDIIQQQQQQQRQPPPLYHDHQLIQDSPDEPQSTPLEYAVNNSIISPINNSGSLKSRSTAPAAITHSGHQYRVPHQDTNADVLLIDDLQSVTLRGTAADVLPGHMTSPGIDHDDQYSEQWLQLGITADNLADNDPNLLDAVVDGDLMLANLADNEYPCAAADAIPDNSTAAGIHHDDQHSELWALLDTAADPNLLDAVSDINFPGAAADVLPDHMMSADDQYSEQWPRLGIAADNLPEIDPTLLDTVIDVYPTPGNVTDDEGPCAAADTVLDDKMAAGIHRADQIYSELWALLDTAADQLPHIDPNLDAVITVANDDRGAPADITDHETSAGFRDDQYSERWLLDTAADQLPPNLLDAVTYNSDLVPVNVAENDHHKSDSQPSKSSCFVLLDGADDALAAGHNPSFQLDHHIHASPVADDHDHDSGIRSESTSTSWLLRTGQDDEMHVIPSSFQLDDLPASFSPTTTYSSTAAMNVAMAPVSSCRQPRTVTASHNDNQFHDGIGIFDLLLPQHLDASPWVRAF